jgi:transcriptional regulator with XRE-family HTH domain
MDLQNNQGGNMALGKRIEKLLIEKNLTKNKFANINNIPSATFSDLLTGKNKNPSLALLSKVASGLNISISELTNENEKLFDITDLKALRGSKSFKEYADYLEKKTGIPIDQILLELYEKGERRLTQTFIDYILSAENISINKNRNSIIYNNLNKNFSEKYIELNEKIDKYDLLDEVKNFVDYLVSKKTML